MLTVELVFILLLIVTLSLLKYTILRRRIPPGPIGWPVIGSMFSVPEILSNPIKFQQLVDKYGPVFTVWNGRIPIVLISSQGVAIQTLTGSTFASRPLKSHSMRVLTNGFKTINSSPYDDYWRATRRNLVSGILSKKSLSEFARVQEQSVHHLVLKFQTEAGAPVDSLSVRVRRTLFEILSSICFGSKLEDEELKELDILMKEATNILHPRIGDFVPVLGILDRDKNKLKTFLKRQNKVIGRLINRFKDNPVPGTYLDTLLKLQESSPLDIDLDVLVREIFIAGTDTTTNCVEWTMANLVNSPKVQRKVYNEICAQVGEQKSVEVGDLPKLTYLEAVVKEALRRHPPVYVTAPHAPTEVSKLTGYEIPEYSTVFVHLHSISNDPKTWNNPEEFIPERFLQGSRNTDMLPFGAGRRMCPGRYLGMLHVSLIIANLVQKFEWRAAGAVDLTPNPGFTVGMRKPLRAFVSKREKSTL